MKDRALDVARHLFPRGKKAGHEWELGNIEGEPGQSFKIAVEGSKVGVWSDFAGGGGGDNLLELWREKKGLTFREAIVEVKAWLGVRDEAPVKRAGKRVYKKPDKSQVAKAAEKDPAIRYLMEKRGLLLTTIREYKIAASKDQKSVCYPYLDENGIELEMLKFIGIELNEKGKKTVFASKESKKCLFGKHLVTPDDRHLYITEGEIDAMTLRQLGYCAVSVPFGAKHESEDGTDPNDEWIENDWDMLSCFERIYLVYDADEEGKKARQSVLKRLGRERCFLVDLPDKDANACLLAGRTSEIHDAIKRAKTQDPAALRNAAEYADEVASLLFDKDGTPASIGVPMPFETPTGIFHWRLHELTVFTGMNGSGKTQYLNYLTNYFRWLGKNLMIASFEVPVPQTIRFLASQVIARDTPRNREELDAACNWLGEGVWFYDHMGQVNRKDLLESMRYACRRYGVQYFIVDSFMKCGLKVDDWNGQKEFMDELTQFVADFDAHLIVVVHSKKKEDERAVAGKMDVKGVGEITDMAHNVITIWRNKTKEKEIKSLKQKGGADSGIRILEINNTKPDAIVECHKQRNGTGDEPEWKLWYDKETRHFACEKKISVPFLPEEEYYRYLPDSDEYKRNSGNGDAEGITDDQPF